MSVKLVRQDSQEAPLLRARLPSMQKQRTQNNHPSPLNLMHESGPWLVMDHTQKPAVGTALAASTSLHPRSAREARPGPLTKRSNVFVGPGLPQLACSWHCSFCQPLRVLVWDLSGTGPVYNPTTTSTSKNMQKQHMGAINKLVPSTRQQGLIDKQRAKRQNNDGNVN